MRLNALRIKGFLFLVSLTAMAGCGDSDNPVVPKAVSDQEISGQYRLAKSTNCLSSKEDLVARKEPEDYWLKIEKNQITISGKVESVNNCRLEATAEILERDATYIQYKLLNYQYVGPDCDQAKKEEKKIGEVERREYFSGSGILRFKKNNGSCLNYVR